MIGHPIASHRHRPAIPQDFSKEAVVTIQFGPFLLDRETRQLRHQDREIHVSPKALELLWRLIEARPGVVAKSELLEHLWPDTFVVEANLSNLVSEIRHALDDGIRESRFVRTVHGRGYAFCGEATAAQPLQSAPGAITCWLEWGRQRFPLGVGQHIIGRDADVTVCLRGATVSRRHARLVVTAAGAELSDCDSKNGTYRGGERVVEPVRLADGDTIGVGSLRVTFREPGKSGSTLTQADAGS